MGGCWGVCASICQACTRDGRLRDIPVTINERLVVVRVRGPLVELLHFDHVLGLIEGSIFFLFREESLANRLHYIIVSDILDLSYHMNFDVLVPKVSLKSKRRTEILLEQPRELALKERLKQHIYV